MDKIENPIVLGVDIGGSHITAALVNLETRTILTGSSCRQLVNSQGKAEDILASWCELVKNCFDSLDIISRRIGIAMPGPFDYENGISLIKDQSKFQAFYGVNIREQLAIRLDIPTHHFRFINDAVSFLQGEVFGGAARSYRRVLGLTLGTGLGSAIHLNGHANDADLWNSGFKNGIAEDYLSGRWFTRRYNELTGNKVKGVRELIHLSGEQKHIDQLFLEFSKNLSDFINPLIDQYEIECVVIGGNISNAYQLFMPELQYLLKKNRTHTAVKIACLKEDASLIGAASCWEDSYILNGFGDD